MEYKNNIMLGIKLPSNQDINGQLQTLIKNLNDTKIDLDINIKNSDVAKQLETLTNLANNFKNSLGGNINLGNINEAINQSMSSMERLNSEVLKTRTVLNQDGTGNKYLEIANGIGVVSKQMEILNQETKQWEKSQQSETIIVNNEKIRKTLEDIATAQQKLNSLQLNGVVNTNEVDRLKSLLSNASENINGKNDIYTSKDISGYLNQVKQLEAEEQNLKNIQDAKNKELEAMYKLQQEDLKQLQQLEQQRERELQQENELIQKQEQAYQQLNVLKANGVINESEINKLEQLAKSSTNLKEINSVLSQIGQTTSRETSISNLSKQIEEAQNKLNKMKQTFGEKLSSSFIQSTESELNKLKEDLKSVDGTNFNGIKNSLSSVKSSMEQVSNETKQMINAMKESNTGGFFTSMSDFLSKSGLFYGTVQGVQMLVSAVKEGVEWNKYLNDSFTDMQITMNISEQSFNKMSNTIDEMGKKIGVNAQDLHDIAKQFGELI